MNPDRVSPLTVAVDAGSLVDGFLRDLGLVVDVYAEAVPRLMPSVRRPDAASSASLLHAAETYARLGWRIHPLRPREKTPLLRGWPDVATSDVETIRGWWRQWPDANVGVVTGPKSGIVVIDIDGNAGEASLAELENRFGKLPATCEQRTGRGRQLFYAYPAGRTIRNTTNLGGFKGVDVRGDGGYVVAPPSIHPNGKTYVWNPLSDPTGGCQLAELPLWTATPEIVEAES
ncbi:MAG: bifunctional DNA primase/polymerase [Gammaproteobacteria bacterium]